jgi:hypothetical protein
MTSWFEATLSLVHHGTLHTVSFDHVIRWTINTVICSVCRNHNAIIFTFKISHRVCYKSNTTGTTCGAGIAYPSGAPEYTSDLYSEVRVARSLVFYIMFCKSLFVLFLFAIVLFVCLRVTISDYHFGIINIFSSCNNKE